MKFLIALLSAALLTGCCCSVTYDMPTPEEDMAMMMQAGAPGPQHELLASLVGTYDVDMTMYMGPGAPPEPMPSTSTMVMAMDGRQLVESFRSDFGGAPFTGRLMMGFDNTTQQWWSVWTDNFSTGYALSHGEYTGDDTITLCGTMRDHKTPDGRPTKVQMTDLSGDQHHFTMWDTGPDGELYVVMDGIYKRRS